MAHELRFAVGILPDLEWPVVLDRFRHVEALGFDLASTGDQFADPMDPSRPWFDLWTLLAAVAQATDHVRIAPYIAQIPLRNPATLARQVLAVDHISNGRVEVGLGLGRPVAPSYRMMGIPNWITPSAWIGSESTWRSSPRCWRTSRRRTRVGTTGLRGRRYTERCSCRARRSRSLRWDRG